MPIIHAVNDKWAHIWRADEEQCGNVFVPPELNDEDIPLEMMEGEYEPP